MQQRRLHLHRRAGLLALALLAAPLAAPPVGAASAQGREAALHRAYYLQHERGELDQALALYRGVADDDAAPPELRAEARGFASALAEDLATRDFARLMPAEAILYAELDRPGEQLGRLLASLGLLKEDGAPAAGFGVSRALIDGALGLRGAALAITSIDPQGGPPGGVLVLHPGELELLRGLIETALPLNARAVDPIAGRPTWSVEGEALVTLTRRLVVAGNDREAIAGVLRRLEGEARGSLAQSAALQQAMAERGDDLFWFCLNPEPVMPLLQGALRQEAQRDPQAAMALAMLDLESLVALAGRLAVDEGGVALDLSLHLDEGHRNLAFDLLRMPSVRRRTLELVPEGAAFFIATALNEQRSAAATVAAQGERRSISLMDFGRELFGNLVDLAVFALPPDGRAQRGGVPDIAAVLRVNDLERSKALWELVLGMGSQAGGAEQGMEPQRFQIAGVAVEAFQTRPVPVLLATLDDALVLGSSRGAIERTLRGMERDRAVGGDPAFAESLAKLDESSSFVAMVHPARCAALAQAFAPPRDAQQLAQIAPLLGELVVTLGLEHSDTHAALRARIEHLPDVSPFVEQMIAQRGRGGHAGQLAPVIARSAPDAGAGSAAPGALRARFDRLACEEGDRAAALDCGGELLAALADDPRALNDLAWALLTEPRYGEAYDELALALSERSNEATGFDNWYHLDTLALACFRAGDVERAVRLQEAALERAAGSDGAGAVEAALERYRAAQAGARGPLR